MRKNFKKIWVNLAWVLGLLAVISIFGCGVLISKIADSPAKQVKDLLNKANSAADAEIAKENLDLALNLVQKSEWNSKKESAVIELEEYLITSIENYQVLIEKPKNESYFLAFKALQDISSKFEISNILLNQDFGEMLICVEIVLLILFVIGIIGSIECELEFPIVILVHKREEKQII